jgi:hypothetical protein
MCISLALRIARLVINRTLANLYYYQQLIVIYTHTEHGAILFYLWAAYIYYKNCKEAVPLPLYRKHREKFGYVSYIPYQANLARLTSIVLVCLLH